MCAIFGYYDRKKLDSEVFAKLNNTMTHRGPDDSGVEELALSNGEWYVGLAHRRLSILDLSMSGHQPMSSRDNQVAIVFNGEIYNFKEIKEELSEYPFTSNCDTEVILAAYLKWGIDCVNKFNGMFAFSVFDKKNETLYLVRDRMGKKPLFYWLRPDGLVFSSELKAVFAYPEFNENVRKDVMGDFLMHRSIHAPNTIYENVYCLEPGTILKYKKGEISKKVYWSVSDTYKNYGNSFKGSFELAMNELDRILHQSIKQRLIADVEVGAFLSGGIDSSIMCAIASQHLSHPVKTFSIGFYDKKIDEAGYAKDVAQFLGCEHEEKYISDDEMLSLVEDIPIFYDQPLADPAEIPLMLLSSLTRQKVKVVLSGDGSDELFGGYGLYQKLLIAQKNKNFGSVLYLLKQLPGIKHFQRLNNLPIEYRMVVCKTNSNTKTQMGVDTYTQILDEILQNPNEYYYQFENIYPCENYAQRRMLLDMDTALPDYMLVKTDRATMRSSLECRCPFMDKDIIEFAFSLPIEYRIDKHDCKKILKELAYTYIPRKLLDRPKSGFTVPLDRWLRGPLKAQIMDWTSFDYLKKQGIFKPEETIRLVTEYMKNGDQGKWSGKNYSKLIWPYFVFQQWYDRYERV